MIWDYATLAALALFGLSILVGAAIFAAIPAIGLLQDQQHRKLTKKSP